MDICASRESEISVLLERGGKHCATGDKHLTFLSDGTAEVSFDDTSLSLVVTMHKQNENYLVRILFLCCKDRYTDTKYYCSLKMQI
jgi:hypothetical protein